MDEKLNILAEELDDEKLACVTGGAEMPENKEKDIKKDHNTPTSA